MRTLEFKVRVPWPEGMTVSQVGQYVRDAVKSWGGQYGIDDPRMLITLNSDKVTVRGKWQ